MLDRAPPPRRHTHASIPSNTSMCEGTNASSKREKTGVTKKLTNAVLVPTALGFVLILVIYLVLLIQDVPRWGGDTKDVMVGLETANIARLALAKAEHAGEIFGRVRANLVQLQAFGKQIMMEEPVTVVVDEYLESVPGLRLQQQELLGNWNFSSWYITGFTAETSLPVVGSSLDGLLNRTTLLDVPFRGMQRQEALMYLAGLDDPSLPDDPDTAVAFLAYPAYDMLEGGFTTYSQDDCDDRFDTGDDDFLPSTFDPRCRGWFQDARASNEPIFTDPYQDWSTGLLTVTPAAPVYAADGETLLGVVGIDMDFTVIETSILGLRVAGEEGYAYLLTSTAAGVAVHPGLDPADVPSILDLEEGVDEDEFGSVLTRMAEECSGSASYQKDGGTWLISWEHERVSRSGIGGGSDGDASSVCSTGGFIVGVTVSEAALLGVFSETESDIQRIVLVASVFMALIMVAIACLTVGLARSLSQGLTQPVVQLVDVVKGLNNLDFSRQGPGPWMLNEVSCPEVEGLMDAFTKMSTVVKFANTSLESGNVEVALQSYTEALILFKKLNNSRGVAIVNNNLGNVYTLQARALSEEAAESSWNKKQDMISQINGKYEDAITNFRLAIEYAEMLVSWAIQQRPHLEFQHVSAPSPTTTGITKAEEKKEEAKYEQDADEASGTAPADSLDMAEAQQASNDDDNDDGGGDEVGVPESLDALKLQLANRKFNLALCLQAKAIGCADGKNGRDEQAARETGEARQLILECEALAAERNDALGSERAFECLLALAVLESRQPGRGKEVLQALDRAERVMSRSPPAGPTPLPILRQRLLAARGEERLAAGDAEAAVGRWAEAVTGCDLLDTDAVRSSLVGLHAQVYRLDLGQGGNPFSKALVRGLGLSAGGDGAGDWAVSNADLEGAIEQALKKVGEPTLVGRTRPVKVDLCFIMDCTGSMGPWIYQAKKKLFAIIEQTKKDIPNLRLRVAYVGYRDFNGGLKQYEGPYDFHSEEELPQLEAKLGNIRAGGGCGYVADVAGGLKHATELSWSSPARLCILFADAPCHGRKYHNVPDAHPEGCPLKVDPAEVIYKLQYALDADFYFIRIDKVTDKMVDVFQSTVSEMATRKNKKNKKKEGDGGGPKFVVHNLGSNDNTFVSTVVESVKGSASGINLRMEKYS